MVHRLTTTKDKNLKYLRKGHFITNDTQTLLWKAKANGTDG